MMNEMWPVSVRTKCVFLFCGWLGGDRRVCNPVGALTRLDRE